MRLLCCSLALLVSIPSVARAHALWADPPPRTNVDGYKNPLAVPECGVARTAAQPLTTYMSGQVVAVEFHETINHPGCFLIDFSPGGDTNWVELANIPHDNSAPSPTRANPRVYNSTVTLPAGVSCTDCTLRLRQIMTSSAVCPPDPIPTSAPYFSCANITVEAPETPDAAMPMDAALPMDAAAPSDASAVMDAAMANDAAAGMDAAMDADAAMPTDAAVTTDAALPSDAAAPVDASMGLDAAVAPDAATVDAAVSLDASVPTDAATMRDATATSDASITTTEWPEDHSSDNSDVVCRCANLPSTAAPWGLLAALVRTIRRRR